MLYSGILVVCEFMSDIHNEYLPKYEEMIKAGMHFGRKKSIFHPRMKPFVFTTKENIYILDLLKTSEGIVQVVDFLRQAIEDKKVVLFVGISKQSNAAIKDLAESLNMPYVTNRWLGGTLTNFKTIISRVKYLEQLEAEQAAGGFEKYTKKEVVLKEREMTALRSRFDGIRSLVRIPDILFLSSLKEGQLPLHEAKLAGIKVVSIVNTDSDPLQVDHAIPANDNSKKSVELILNSIKNALTS